MLVYYKGTKQDVISQSHFTFNPINTGSYWQTQNVGKFCTFILFICRFDDTFLVWALQVMFYEALKDLTEYGKQRWIPSLNSYVNISIEGLVLGGLAGGMRLASLLSPVKPIWVVCDLIQRSILLDAGSLFSYIVQVLVHISPLPWMLSKQGCKCRDPQQGIITFYLSFCGDACAFVYSTLTYLSLCIPTTVIDRAVNMNFLILL